MKYQRFSLRIPSNLHEQLMDKAEKTSKSVNAEIIYRLKESFEPKPQGNERFQIELASLDDVRRVVEKDNKNIPKLADNMRHVIREELERFNQQ